VLELVPAVSQHPEVSSSDPEFLRQSETCLRGLQAALDGFDPDELEADLTGGVLRIVFADGRACVLNRQAAARQIWMAEGASAWHFESDAAGKWLDTKGRGDLLAILAAILTRRLGRDVRV